MARKLSPEAKGWPIRGIPFEPGQLDLLRQASKAGDRSVSATVRIACEYWLKSKDGLALLRRAREQQAPPEAQPGTPETQPGIGEAS